MKRWLAAGAASIAVALATAVPASAELYPPDTEPRIEVSASSVCVGDVPYLSWNVSVFDTDADEVTVTFLNPGGASYTLAGQGLSGTALWPGAVLEGGVIVDWPGWYLEDGEWVEGADGWEWAVPQVDVLFEVNPEAVVTVDYPLPSAACYGPPAGDDEEDDVPGGGGAVGGEETELPNLLGLTGSQSGALLVVVGVLLAAGITLLVVRRRAES